MRELKLRVKGAKRINAHVTVDGKSVKLKKNNFGTYEGNYQTEKDKVEVCVYKVSEITGRLWFLMSIFFYILSIFGLLDPLKEKNAIVIQCRLMVDLSGVENGKLELSVNANSKSEKAVEVVSDFAIEEIENKIYEDEKVKKRLKILKIAKIFTFLTFVALTIVLIVVTIK